VSAAAERTERSVATPGHALESYLEPFEAHSRTPGTEAKGSRARIKSRIRFDPCQIEAVWPSITAN
jgi:hypothetical protein